MDGFGPGVFDGDVGSVVGGVEWQWRQAGSEAWWMVLATHPSYQVTSQLTARDLLRVKPTANTGLLVQDSPDCQPVPADTSGAPATWERQRPHL